jgi:hypothetical protein
LGDDAVAMPSPIGLSIAALAVVGCLASCDQGARAVTDSPAQAASLPPPAPTAPEVRDDAPEIIVDHATVAVGKDRVPVAEAGLGDRVAALVAGRPGVEGRAVDLIVMRNVKPSYVVAVLQALHRAKAGGATVKSEARDGTTQAAAVSFAPAVPDCATVAWIAKDAAIDVWPAGGGAAKRVVRGLAGPDMTLGLAAVRERWEGCSAPEIVVGGDDAMTWGVVFDLTESALTAPGARVSAAIVVAAAVPGHKVALP